MWQFFTFQWFDDLQAVGQVGPGAPRGATRLPWAAIRVVGACWCPYTGRQAVVWCQEATGAIALLALCCQGTEFTLTLHVKERPLRGVVLLAGGQALQSSFQVLASRGAWLTQALWPTHTTGGGRNNVLSASSLQIVFLLVTNSSCYVQIQAVITAVRLPDIPFFIQRNLYKM